MATQVRLARQIPPDPALPVGAWWPQSRRLHDSLAELFALWPPEEGRIRRVLYSPPDWDDHPRSVPVAGRWVKTGSFPDDDTHELVLSMADGKRLRLAVIASETPPASAGRLLAQTSGSVEGDAAVIGWENEGGHS